MLQGNTFDFIKLPFVLKTFVLSIFEWLIKTGFTVTMLFVEVEGNHAGIFHVVMLISRCLDRQK